MKKEYNHNHSSVNCLSRICSGEGYSASQKTETVLTVTKGTLTETDVLVKDGKNN